MVDPALKKGRPTRLSGKDETEVSHFCAVRTGKMPTSPRKGSSSNTQPTPGSRAWVTIAKSKAFMRIVRKLVMTNRTLRFAYSDAYRGVDVSLDPYMLAGVTQNAKEVQIQSVEEECIKSLQFLP